MFAGVFVSAGNSPASIPHGSRVVVLVPEQGETSRLMESALATVASAQTPMLSNRCGTFEVAADPGHRP